MGFLQMFAKLLLFSIFWNTSSDCYFGFAVFVASEFQYCTQRNNLDDYVLKLIESFIYIIFP